MLNLALEPVDIAIRNTIGPWMNRSYSRLDLEKLAKILALTASSSDGEALAAARKAAQMLDKANLTYRDLLSAVSRAAPKAITARNADAELAWKKVRELRQELEAVRREQSAPRQATPRHSGANVSPMARLKDRLLAEKPLRVWEREALLQFKQIRPQSREEYYVRWLMQRYAMAS